ncbi:Zn-dependent hydrolase [Adhaeretor mobilis]|uniref:N-carbamoyl-L-amino acid hydrolase n=1 Tax=Adhaeretor mobilis TaxID=1930276 RepID=A0A517MQF7_9BACT|nr:Zn-dependent hydrolase [Adhaeretor mobilis]QDS97111.1 N-carbamoyl-L-amino acid hydrolase [Adhaeretor mobilis]
MSPNTVAIADVVMSRCDELAACSEDPECITRRYLSPPMHDVHDRLSGWMRTANLTTRIDNAGNLIGRREGTIPTDGASSSENPAPNKNPTHNKSTVPRALLVGSHLDTVPGGGRYDGVLGVLMGLALVELLGDTPLPFHIDVVGFSEEEGVRFSKPYLGSSAMVGEFQAEWLERQDADGTTLSRAIVDFGLAPDCLSDSAYSPEEVIGFIEPHLEQGPVLESCGSPVGVVSAIAGQTRLRLNFTGEAAHAGTTPMQGRRDALVSSAAFIRTVSDLGQRVEGLRATVGQLQIVPNAPNVIPGSVELSLDVRHPEDEVREQAIKELLVLGEKIGQADGTTFSVLEETPEAAVVMGSQLKELLSQAVVESGYAKVELPSGAGHDAVMMAKRFPTAMLFLRHPGGVSHHPDERVERDDVAVGIEVLGRFVERLAGCGD